MCPDFRQRPLFGYSVCWVAGSVPRSEVIMTLGGKGIGACTLFNLREFVEAETCHQLFCCLTPLSSASEMVQDEDLFAFQQHEPQPARHKPVRMDTENRSPAPRKTSLSEFLARV
jgi:hypothetical protein